MGCVLEDDGHCLTDCKCWLRRERTCFGPSDGGLRHDGRRCNYSVGKSTRYTLNRNPKCVVKRSRRVIHVERNLGDLARLWELENKRGRSRGSSDGAT